MMRNELVRGPETVLLTIDGAGKVESAKMASAEADPELLEAAKAWKFIPAFKGGHAVACRTKMEIQPYQ
jgi:TonB family protein